MSTRTGDLDPGLAYYLERAERMTAARFQRMVNHESGLLGVSGTSSDLRDLCARSRGCPRGGSCGAVLLSGEEVDRLVRRSPRRRWTRSSLRPASARMRRGSGSGSAMGWASWASNWIAGAMRKTQG